MLLREKVRRTFDTNELCVAATADKFLYQWQARRRTFGSVQDCHRNRDTIPQPLDAHWVGGIDLGFPFRRAGETEAITVGEQSGFDIVANGFCRPGTERTATDKLRCRFLPRGESIAPP